MTGAKEAKEAKEASGVSAVGVVREPHADVVHPLSLRMSSFKREDHLGLGGSGRDSRQDERKRISKKMKMKHRHHNDALSRALHLQCQRLSERHYLVIRRSQR